MQLLVQDGSSSAKQSKNVNFSPSRNSGITLNRSSSEPDVTKMVGLFVSYFSVFCLTIYEQGNLEKITSTKSDEQNSSFEDGSNRCLNHWRSPGSEIDGHDDNSDDLEKLLTALSSLD